MDRLNEHVFSDLRHKFIFQKLKEFWKTKYYPSAADVAKTCIGGVGVLKGVDGYNYIKELEISYCGSAVTFYADVLIDSYRRRQIIISSNAAINAITHEEKTSNVLDKMHKSLSNISDTGSKEPRPISDVMDNFRDGKSITEFINGKFEEFQRTGKNAIDGVSTGIKHLDNKLSGLVKKRLVIFGARPAMGKSEIVVQMVSNMSKKGLRCLVFSLEMSAEEWAERLLGVEACVHFSRFKMLKAIEYQQIEMAAKWLKEKAAMIIVDDDPGATIDAIKARTRREIHKNQVDAVFIDHLGLIKCREGNSKYEQISFVSRELKLMAKELDVPVFCLCQLNRDVKNREGNRPTMSDLRDSGSIEQDADAVILLHRQDYYNPDLCPGKMELIIDKNRQGERGIVYLHYDKHTATMGEYLEIHKS